MGEDLEEEFSCVVAEEEDTELLLENVRIVNVGKDTLKLLKWEEFINEIKDK